MVYPHCKLLNSMVPLKSTWSFQVLGVEGLRRTNKNGSPVAVPRRAMQRYESVLGGLTNALNVLQGRFSQPFKMVRASVDALTKGPVIAT